MVLPKITNEEYNKILEYYNITPTHSTSENRKLAYHIMSQKLCRCLKKLEPYKTQAIGICTKSIFNQKGYTRGKFRCKGKSYVEFTVKSRKTQRRKTQSRKKQKN